MFLSILLYRLTFSYAPWCGHCKNREFPLSDSKRRADIQSLLSTSSWRTLSLQLVITSSPGSRLSSQYQDKVVIAKTDADGVGRELGSRYAVQGFPSEYHLHFIIRAQAE